jgi:hypothetical protein
MSPNLSNHKSSSLQSLSRAQLRTTLLARAYYSELYLLFFRGSKDEIGENEIFTTVLVNEDSLFQTPGWMCAQTLSRALRLLRSDPDRFAIGLIKSHATINILRFAFSTFPACYGFFTRAANASAGSLFVLSLVSADAPHAVVSALLLAFLFSAYAFTDALWTAVHRRFCTKQRLGEEAAITGLCGAIEACAPLLPACHVAAVQAALGHCPQVCCLVVLRFLNCSFELWYHHSPDGTTFGCGPALLEFLHRSEDFYAGNSVTIVASMIGGKRRIGPYSAVPAEEPPEVAVFSSGDLRRFRDAFAAVDPPLKGLATIAPARVEPDSVPYLLDCCQAPAAGAPWDRPLIATRELRAGALAPGAAPGRALLRARQGMDELEDLLRIRLLVSMVEDLQRSVMRFRNYGFARYARGALAPIGAGAGMDALVRAVLRTCPERASLVEPFVTERLNQSPIAAPPKAAGELFTAVRREFAERSLEAMQAVPCFRALIGLIPQATRRGIERYAGYGDVFLMFRHFFWSVRMVTKHFHMGQDFARCLGLVVFNSEFPALLNFYLLTANLFAKNPVVKTQLDGDGDWECFLAIMEAMIKSNPSLWKEVQRFGQPR